MTADLDLITPRYGAASLADVVPSALAVLGVPEVDNVLRLELDGVRRIVLLLVDGLGARQLPLLAGVAPTLAALPGTVLTSGFPSTTPVSLVTLGAGAAPGAHGVLGFTVRTPDGALLNHLRWRDEPDPADWQPLPTRWQQAAAAGVAVTVVSRPEYEGTGLSVAANRGGVYRGATGLGPVAAEILAAVRASPAPALISAYVPELDKAGHESGAGSPPWLAVAAELDELVTQVLDGLPPDAALLVTSDHGHLVVPQEGRFDASAPSLAAGVAAIAGEPRVRYLHTLPGAADDVVAAWSAVLGPAARVLPRAAAIAEGWFGPVAERHLQRIGDVVAICRGRHVVLCGTEPDSVRTMVGFHGSATAAEMEIPLLVGRR